MRRDEWVHERLEVRPPPLRQGVADFPFVVYAFARELRSDRGKPLIQSVAESRELLFMWVEVIAWSAWGGAVNTHVQCRELREFG